MTTETVSLTKGENVSLTKAAGGTLTAVNVELGWTPPDTQGAAYDLDAMALLLGGDNKVINEGGFVFYSCRNRTADNGATVYHVPAPENPYGRDMPTDLLGAVVHLGDNLTGAGNSADDPDETIAINLAKVDPACERILIVVDIFNGPSLNQKFGQVKSSFIRVRNPATGELLAKYDLTEDMSTETTMVFGELYRKDADWKFKAIEGGWDKGLKALAEVHGVHVG